ncbi:MAG TPA: hypothetical protein VFP34_14235 [Microlunatus sp.]|nr:hypothetical protein [Microlunatus sp.]
MSGVTPVESRDGSAAPPVVSALLDALLRRDFDEVERCLAPEVRFRALVPTGVREASSAEAAARWLRTWFGSSEAFQVLAAGAEPFAGRSRIWYRFALEREGRSTVIDQEGFCDAGPSGITDLALVCSGFRPASPST